MEFEDIYYSAVSEYEKILEERNKAFDDRKRMEEPNGVNTSHQLSGMQNNAGIVTNQASIVKLVALDVPMFNGEYNEWSTFYDMFVALIHSNEALTDVQRFFFI